jgi:multisubunit Na+/H+ antiporter MnhE subunit
VKSRRGPAYWLIAFVFAYLIWLIHDDTAKLPELLAGVIAAALAATATELARRERIAGIAVRARFLRRAWRLVPSACRDTVALTRAALAQLVRPQAARGRTVTIPFGHGGEEPDENGRRALAQGLGSFAPSTIVVGIDPDRNVLIAHQLAPSGDASDLDPLGLG